MTYSDGRIYKAHEKTVRREHQALAEEIDSLCRALDPTPQNISKVIFTLQEILKQAKALFRHENRLMKISNPPERLNHKRDHAYLVKGLRDCIGSYVDATEPISPSIGEYLGIWLIYHDKKYDHAFFEFINPSNLCQGRSRTRH